MSLEIIASLSKQAIEDAINPDIIEYSFVCGSVAQRLSTPKSDIDIFICLKEPILARRKKLFTDNYFQLHQELLLHPDCEYPGELMTISELDTAMDIAWGQEPTKKIDHPQLYDGLVWAGMLSSSDKLLLAENSTSLENHTKIGSRIVNAWADTLQESVPKLPEESSDIFLKRIVKYEGPKPGQLHDNFK